MSAYVIIISPVINRQDGVTRFEKEFEVANFFKVTIEDGQVKLYSSDDSVTFWSTDAKVTNVTSNSGRVYETLDHFKPLLAGSSTSLEQSKDGIWCFKFKRDTRFNKIVEFTAIVTRR